MIVLSVIEAVLLVLVLAVALTLVRRRLEHINSSLAALASVLSGIETELRAVGPAVGKINAPFEAIVGALPGIAEKAESVARRSLLTSTQRR